MKKIILLVVTGTLLLSCSEQSMKRTFGGTVEIKLPEGERLMEATWKEDNLFYLTEPADPDYVPKVKTFRESSSFGVMETTVKFIEQ